MEPKPKNEPVVAYEKLDLSTEEYTAKLAEAPVFAKKAEVHAVVAVGGEKIETVLANGIVETVNIANSGDAIITNPGGEQYIIPAETFTKRYEATTEEGVFRAKGMARALKNDTGAPIEITAPWGESQFGDENCLIATVFDPDSPDQIGSDRYIIGADEFADTYGPIEEVLADEV
ncbi:MAG: PGDYG domain-containing protein [Candidatus Saccharimonadales bacterium]